MNIFERLYFNDTIIKKYVSNQQSASTTELLQLKIYNTDMKFIIEQLKTKLTNQYAVINIYDNDTGLVGWCLSQLNYKTTYKYSSKYPMHAVYITSPSSTTTKPSVDDVNLHFITTLEEYAKIDFTSNKNIIFATSFFDKKLKFHKTPYFKL
jgi:hypothetical protein